MIKDPALEDARTLLAELLEMVPQVIDILSSAPLRRHGTSNLDATTELAARGSDNHHLLLEVHSHIRVALELLRQPPTVSLPPLMDDGASRDILKLQKPIEEFMRRFSLINQLPMELLCFIFELVCTNNGRDSPHIIDAFRLRLVSRRWNAIAISHPRLWCALDIKFGLRAQPVPSLVLVRRLLRLSGSLPLTISWSQSIQLRQRHDRGERWTRPSPKYFTTSVGAAHRLEHIKVEIIIDTQENEDEWPLDDEGALRLPGKVFKPLACPALQTMDVTVHDISGYYAPLSDLFSNMAFGAKNLRWLRWDFYTGLWWNLNPGHFCQNYRPPYAASLPKWNHLTHVEIRHAYLTDVAAILNSLPAVEDLDCELYGVYRPLSAAPARLERLERLRIIGEFDNHIGAFLSLLEAPALCDLALGTAESVSAEDDNEVIVWDQEACISFITRSNQTNLRSLSFEWKGTCYCRLEQVLELVLLVAPSLHHLTFFGLDLSTTIVTSLTRSRTDSRNPLPQLKTLSMKHMGGLSFADGCLAAMIESYLPTLDGVVIGLCPLCNDLSSADAERLSEMVTGGAPIIQEKCQVRDGHTAYYTYEGSDGSDFELDSE